MIVFDVLVVAYEICFTFTGRFVDVSCGGTFTVAITESRKVFTWGKTSRGQLGRSIGGPVSAEPKEVSFPDFTNMKIVSLSASHGSSLLAVSGKYYACFYDYSMHIMRLPSCKLTFSVKLF